MRDRIMDQITCPICRKELSSTDKSCPNCGYKEPENLFEKNMSDSVFKKNEPSGVPKKKKVLFILVFIILMTSFSVYNWIVNQNNLSQQKPEETSDQATSQPSELPSVQQSSEQQSSNPNVHKIKYVVTGTAKNGNITIQIPGGGSEQHDITLPYESPVYDFKNRDFAFLIAINQSDEGGSIIAEIIVDGKPFRKATSTGSYSTASVRWTVGSEE
jgi:hypothetical protein